MGTVGGMAGYEHGHQWRLMEMGSHSPCNDRLRLQEQALGSFELPSQLGLAEGYLEVTARRGRPAASLARADGRTRPRPPRSFEGM